MANRLKYKKKPGRPAVRTSPQARAAAEGCTRALVLLKQSSSMIADRREQIENCAQYVLADIRRLRATQALFKAITAHDNPARVTDAWLASTLFNEPVWAFWKKQVRIASEGTVRNFARAKFSSGDRQVVASYLTAFYLLHRVGHPCFKEHIAQTLANSNVALDDMYKVLNTDEGAPTLRIRRLVERGRTLLTYLNLGLDEHNRSIDSLLKTGFFRGRLEPSATDAELGRLRLGAVRLSARRDDAPMAGSVVQLSLIMVSHGADQAREKHIHIETFLTKDGKERPVSDGYVLVRNKELILFQNKSEGKGFNISVIPLSELNGAHGWLRGLMITVDTSSGAGALLSRMATYHAEPRATIPLNVQRIDITRTAAKAYPATYDLAKEIAAHLRNEGLVAVRRPGDQLRHMSGWDELREFLREHHDREFDPDELRGYRLEPIRAL